MSEADIATELPNQYFDNCTSKGLASFEVLLLTFVPSLKALSRLTREVGAIRTLGACSEGETWRLELTDLASGEVPVGQRAHRAV